MQMYSPLRYPGEKVDCQNSLDKQSATYKFIIAHILNHLLAELVSRSLYCWMALLKI